MNLQFTQLADTVLEICDRGPVYYVPNFGNFGDGLLRHAALKFFDDINLQYREMTTVKRDWYIPAVWGGTVIYGAGGAWCRHFNHGAYYVKKFSRRFKVLVLPSSYEMNYSIPRTTFYRRDNYESKVSMPLAPFCHDLAFYLKGELVGDASGKGIGYFFRTDAESAGHKAPSQNRDVSSEGNHLSDVLPFVSAINKFSVIRTDRLHVSIVACLLGKEVHLYPGNYFKNRAVYLTSIKGNFENAYYHENIDF